MYKKIIPILLIIFMLTGCSQKQPVGDIKIMEDEPLVIMTTDEHVLFDGGEKPDLEFKVLEDAYAGFSIEYPSDWVMKTYSSNYMTISSDFATITIHHQPTVSTYSWEEDAKTVFNNFDSMAEKETFDVGSYYAMNRRARQTISNMEILNDSPFLMKKEFENLKMMNEYGEFIAGKVVEKRYMLQYDGFDSIISIVALKDKQDEAFSIIDYMIGTIRTVGVAYDSSKSIPVLDRDILIPPTFDSTEVELNGQTVSIYKSEQFGDAFSECFIAKTRVPDRLETQFIIDIAVNSLYGIRDGNCNEGDEYNFEINSNKKVCTFTSSEVESAFLASKGTVWNMEMYSDGTDMVIIGYPLAKREMIKSWASVQ